MRSARITRGLGGPGPLKEMAVLLIARFGGSKATPEKVTLPYLNVP